MTNKINGIDVSECDYFEKQHIEDMYKSDDCNVCIDNFCALCWKECEKHNGCYFKQLKRLQEENKRLQMLSCANCGEKYLSPDGAELYEKNVQLQQENEKIKNQYNCYACGNCNGKEDYINLEKHHKGLRKQFDEFVKRNNTLSLRIEELEKENEKLKKKNTELLNLANNGGALLATESAKTKKYKQALEEIREFVSDEINKTDTDDELMQIYGTIYNRCSEVLNDRD